MQRHRGNCPTNIQQIKKHLLKKNMKSSWEQRVMLFKPQCIPSPLTSVSSTVPGNWLENGTPFPPNYWSTVMVSPQEGHIVIISHPCLLLSEVKFQASESERLGVPFFHSAPTGKMEALPWSTENSGAPISFSQKALDSTAMAESLPGERSWPEKQRDQSFPKETDLGNWYVVPGHVTLAIKVIIYRMGKECGWVWRQSNELLVWK